jgi:hypothetical protein
MGAHAVFAPTVAEVTGKDIFFNAGDFAEPGSFGSLFRKPRVASPRAKPLKLSILEIDGGSMF